MPDKFDPKRMHAPIPGISLTASPDKKYPWEQPPKFTDEAEAMKAIYAAVTSKEGLDHVLGFMRKGVSVQFLTESMLQTGFEKGAWTPDMILLLTEPVAYMLVAFAHLAGIDPVIYDEEDQDMDIEEEAALIKFRDMVGLEEPSVIDNVVPTEVRSKVKEALKGFATKPTEENM